jgi:uncharacterized membrane protein YraQ (UPF0718 family)
MNELLMGAGYRMLTALLHAAPTILCGLVVAAVLRRLVGAATVRSLLAAGSITSLVRAWLLGMLLPVCSIGAIPVARELSRAGVGGAAVLAFAVSAPLFNPISLLYGLTLSHPLVIVGFALASMAVVTVVGLAWERLGGGDSPLRPEADELAVPPGWRRAAALGLALGREAAGPAAGYAAVAIVGVGALAACLPFGSLQRSLKAFDPAAIPTMAAIGLPAFLTPTDAMMQIGSMFDHGNSVGAAYILLSVGAGLNLGLVAWAWRTWGMRPTLAWLGVLLAVVFVIAFAIERPLSFRDSPPEDHTHAFDVFCQPFAAGTAAPATRVAELLAERVPRHEWLALATLAIVVTAGAMVRWFDPAGRIERRLAAAASPASGRPAGRPAWDVAVPGPVLGGVLLAGLVATSVVAAYLYYPDLPTAIEDLRYVEGETHAAALAGDRRRTQVWIESWEDLIRRTEVGLWIRRGRVAADAVTAGEALRERIEALEHAVLDEDEVDRDAVAAILKQGLDASRSHRQALRGEPTAPD